MEYIKIEDSFPRVHKSAVTLGKFDGLHRGHRKLIHNILMQKEAGLTSVVFSFNISEQMILSKEERKKLLEKTGIDIFMECPLNKKIKHMSPEDFIREILIGDLNVAYVTVGEDFRFGYERKGTPQMLEDFGKKYGFHTEILSKEMEGRRKVSSTYIREELRKGNMEKVRSLMGMDYMLEGEVVHGRGLGHKVLFPTTNLIPSEDKIMPPNGVYATISEFENQCFEGITNIGYKPTVGGNFLGVETYLFNCNENLYGKQCNIYFKHFQREERKFDSLESLKQQLETDVRKTKNYFASVNTKGR